MREVGVVELISSKAADTINKRFIYLDKDCRLYIK